MLAKVGVKISLTAQSKSKHFKKMLSKKSDMFVFGWASSTTLDAHSFLQNIMHTPGNNKGNWNPGGYSNAELDKLEGLVAKETNRDKRRALITEAFSIHKKEIGQITLCKGDDDSLALLFESLKSNDLNITTLPLRNRQNEEIGLLCLINKKAAGGKVNKIENGRMAFVRTFSGFASVSLESRHLLEMQKRFEPKV